MSYKFQAYRGDTVPFDITVTLSGAPYDLTGTTLFFTLKRRAAALDAAALISKQTGTDIAIVNAAAGTARLVLSPTDTAAPPLNVELYFDLQLKTTAGDIYTIASGAITFLQDITLRTA
jgi:hypothetical protein